MIIRLSEPEKMAILVGTECSIRRKLNCESTLLFCYCQKENERSKIRYKLAEAIAEGVDIAFFEISEYTLVMLFLVKKDADFVESILDMVGTVLERCNEMGFTDGQIYNGIDGISARINKMIKSFEYEKRNSKNDSCGLRYYKDIKEKSTMIGAESIDSLTYLFEHGKVSELEHRIDEITENIRTRDNDLLGIAPTSIKRFFLELSAYSFHAMYDKGVDIDKVLDFEDPYEKIFNLDETPKIKEWYLNSCKKLYDEYQNIQSERKNTIVLEIQTYVVDNIHNKDLSVNQIAESLNLSAAYISSYYSRETGKTIIGYIIEKRLEIAKKLLSETDMTISEVSKAVGYYSERYFYSVFKNNMGFTPTQYRKNQHKM